MVFADFSRLFAASLLFASTAAIAQTARVQSGRCDPFRSHVSASFCARTVTAEVSGGFLSEKSALRDPSVWGTNRKWADTTNGGAFSIAFAPFDWIKLGLGYSHSQHSFKSVQSGGFMQTDTFKSNRDTFSANLKLRAVSAEFAGGTHQVFVLGSVNYRLATTEKNYSNTWWFPFWGTPKTRVQAEYALQHGLQSSHRWAIGESGLSITVVNSAMFTNQQRATRTQFEWETRALAAHEAYGVALGPKVSIRTDLPEQTGKRPYVLAGAVGIWQPAKLFNMPALSGLTLEGSALWLVNRNIDAPVPAWFGPQIQPKRIRTEVQARARYVYQY